MPSFPFQKQHDSADCGPSCLSMISAYFGRRYDIETLRERCYITRKGVSLLGLSEAAESIGLQTQGVSISWEQLKTEAPLPAIIHWKQSHFVVVYRIKNGNSVFPFKKHGTTVLLADPAHGLLEYDQETFLSHWYGSTKDPRGVALLVETTPRFYFDSSEAAKNTNIALHYLLQCVHPYRRYIVQLFLGLFTGTLITLAFPLLTQAIVDYGINSKDMGFILVVLIAQMVLNFGQMANQLIQGWISLHVTSRVSIKFISGFLAKLMRLPIAYFYTRTIGDVMQRITDQNRVQNFLTGTLVTSLFSIITLITYSFILWSYDAALLGVFYLGSFLYISWISVFLKMRRDLDYKRFQESANNQDNIVQLITGMQEIRLAGCEREKRWEWERIQAKLFKVGVKGLILNQNQVIGSTFIDQAKNIFISYLSAQAVISGQITLGMMIAIQYIIGQLNAPVQQFIGFIQAGQDAKISLDRLNAVYNKDDEESPKDGRIKDIPLDAHLKVQKLTFQYEGPTSEKVLDNISFDIPANKTTAIVGVSGSGKTTLLKMLLGIYQPVGGKILLNDIPIDSYSPSSWRQNCAVVMQDGLIFSDTIANNICMQKSLVDRSRLEEAITAANIRDFIESLPLRYNTKIGPDGHGLSSGQKQRILIARAIYKNAGFIFFDEATNALDAKNEKVVISNLNEVFKNKTVIIIAHRLSTIKRADQILVLDKGKIVEKGTHDDLVGSRGTYLHLIENQLS